MKWPSPPVGLVERALKALTFGLRWRVPFGGTTVPGAKVCSIPPVICQSEMSTAMEKGLLISRNSSSRFPEAGENSMAPNSSFGSEGGPAEVMPA